MQNLQDMDNCKDKQQIERIKTKMLYSLSIETS